MKICVVIAAYNEKENILPLTERIVGALSSMAGYSWSLIYVIEGEDGTKEIVENLAADNPEIRVLYQRKRAGLGAAFRRGFAAVPDDVDAVVTMDADLNHQPEEIPALMATFGKGDVDILVGSRKKKGSRVEGVPRWKTILSDSINNWMQRLTKDAIQDRTSGFRIYRRNLLHSLKFENNGFACLPEILMVALARGARIEEASIRFTFRTIGKSKMSLIPTSFSYLYLFLSRGLLSLWTLGALGFLLVGLILRLALILPLHKFPAESDSVLVGLGAMEVLDGKMPVFFPGGARLGAQSCYLTAGLFKLMGISRLALAIPPVLYGCLFNIFMYLFFREMLGKRLALLAVIFIIFPPTQFLLVVYPPWAYGEILMYCAGALWLGNLFGKKGANITVAFFYGLCIGLGLWTSFQTLMIFLPQWVWLLFVKRVKIDIKAGVALTGCLASFSPWLLFVFNAGVSSVLGEQALRPSTSLEQVWNNFQYCFDYNLPILLFGQTADQLLVFSRQGLQASLYFISLLLFFVLFLKQIFNRHDSCTVFSSNCFSLSILSGFIIVAVLLLYSFSGAGAVRGWTVRYIAPIYLAFVMAWTIGLGTLLSVSRFAVIIIAVIIVSLNAISNYPVLAHLERKAQQAAMIDDRILLEVLRQNDIQAVVGGYWHVYYLNFTSRQNIVAVPIDAVNDYMGYAEKLKDQTVRWALIGKNRKKLKKWADGSRLKGDLINVGHAISVFLPTPNPPVPDSMAFISLVRDSSH